ncbi:MAG: hypothetical protein VXY43_02855 [Pseudomonadota bacterium]|nr:hypothetical protein [Pseudomonadota bacterium]
MSGSDVLNELRKNGDETPVIILSGHTEIEARLSDGCGRCRVIL